MYVTLKKRSYTLVGISMYNTVILVLYIAVVAISHNYICVITLLSNGTVIHTNVKPY